MTEQSTIASPSPAYATFKSRHDHIVDLLGGTTAMRAAKKTWLPQETAESTTEYDARVARSVLHGGLESAIKRTAGKPFSKPVTLAGFETLPKQLQWMESDVDREGSTMTAFARRLFEDALAFGKSHFFVDYPALPGPITLKDEVDNQIRPYWVHVPALSLIGWRSHRSETGAMILDEIRVRSDQYVSAGDGTDPWRDELLRQVRYYRRTEAGVEWQVWESRDSIADWMKTSEGLFANMPEIPLVTLYFNRTGYLEAVSPFDALAWQNVAHWQSRSDQTNILRYARIPMPYQTGITSEEMEKQAEIGGARVWRSVNPNAKFGFVEPTGAAIKSGAEDVRHIEEIMEALGSAPLAQRSGNVVATARAIDESAVTTDAQAYALATKQALREGLWWSARWLGITELPEQVGVDVYLPPPVIEAQQGAIGALQADVVAGRITKERYLTEAQRKGLYSEDMDPQVEAAAAEAEAPDVLGRIEDGDDFGDEPEDGDGEQMRADEDIEQADTGDD